MTLPGAGGSVITVAYLVPVWGNGTWSGGEPAQNPVLPQQIQVWWYRAMKSVPSSLVAEGGGVFHLCPTAAGFGVVSLP